MLQALRKPKKKVVQTATTRYTKDDLQIAAELSAWCESRQSRPVEEYINCKGLSQAEADNVCRVARRIGCNVTKRQNQWCEYGTPITTDPTVAAKTEFFIARTNLEKVENYLRTTLLICHAAEVNSNIRLALEEIHRAKEKLNKYANTI